MKLTHKINHGWTPDLADPAWAAQIEREVDNQTAHRDTLWAKAERRLERAQARLAGARRQPTDATTPTRLAKLEQVVEARRQELREIEHLMTQTPAGSQHRGRGSYRGVPA